MFKCLFRSILLVVVLGGIGYVVLGYQIVRTKDGIHFLKKEDFGVSKTYVDTRDWGPLDYIRESRISKALGEIEWSRFKEATSENWNDLKDQIGEIGKNNDLGDSQVGKSLKKLETEVKQKYDKLVKRWKDEEISFDEFGELVVNLKKWTSQRLKEINRGFDEEEK